MLNFEGKRQKKLAGTWKTMVRYFVKKTAKLWMITFAFYSTYFYFVVHTKNTRSPRDEWGKKAASLVCVMHRINNS
jgi:hypothetical protein